MTHPQRRRVLRQRLATQRLSTAGLRRGADVVRLLTCVQAQEHAHALWSLGIRTAHATFGSLSSEFDSSAFVRTHILRPTWHFVAREDLRWILALTSPRVLRLRRGWFQRLGLDEDTLGRGVAFLEAALAGNRYLSRAELGRLTPAAGLPGPGPALGDLLMVAELRGVVCSGPMSGAQHTYALVDEVVPATAARSRDEALAELARRFFAGHGPARLHDLTRWASLTVSDARAAIHANETVLEPVDVDGETHWFDPSVPSRTTRPRAAHLLPLYDEATLTYPAVGFPTLPGHPSEGAPDQWVGNVVVDETIVGTWRRRVHGRAVEVRLALAPDAGRDQRALADAAADRLATFLGLTRQPATSGS